MQRIHLVQKLVAIGLALTGIACAAGDGTGSTAPRGTGALRASGPTAPAQSFVPLATVTSPDGYLTVTLSSTLGQDATGVNDTFLWTATNKSTALSIPGVTLGSNWGDYCGGNCTPGSPTLVSLGAGCAGQGASEIPPSAHFGAWCTPVTGVTLAPGASVSGTVTLRPGSGGPPRYIVYSLYDDPITGQQKGLLGETTITNRNIVAPAAVDEQLAGSASTGSPSVGRTFNYSYHIKNAGPWGTYGGVAFTDTLPTGVTYVGYAATPGVLCNAAGQTVTCVIPDLLNQNGQSTTIALTVTAPAAPQQIVNTATIAFTAPQTDLNTANNSLTIVVASK